MSTIKTKPVLAFVALLGLSATASAETWTTTGSGVGDPLTFNGNGGTTVEINGFRTQINGTGGNTYYTPTAYAYGSGVGVKRSGDYHTLGNNDSSTDWADGIVLDFGTELASISQIVLTSQNGWSGSSARDQDFELWAFTGAGTPTLPTLRHGLWSTENWMNIASVDGDRAGTSGLLEKSYNTPNTVNSSRWIVVAANQDTKLDAFKFKGFTASISTPCIPGTPGCGGGGGSSVPVPGTLALLGLGALLGRKRFLKPA